MKLFSRITTTDRTPIFFGNDTFSSIDRLVYNMRPSDIFILVDPNTREHCLPHLIEKTRCLENARVIETGEGESSKTLANAEKLWNELMASGANRSSLMINLGGGVVSDLGGFVAAGYQRGISYINIPTSLVGQADASIGGKTAVNLGNIKNQVGFFYPARAVFIMPLFLKTLPEKHLRSGLAEIIKTALISDANLWRKILRNPVRRLLQKPVESRFWFDLIAGTVKYKNKVVVQDYRECKLRKVLNFGHTVGHALEAFSHIRPGNLLLHGEAVAAGMICASYLSHLKAGLAVEELDAIKTYLAKGFPVIPVEISSIPAVMQLMMHDKKEHKGELQFTLISKPGHPLMNVSCENREILEAIEFYNSLSGNNYPANQ